jgi:YfiH family protein
VSLPPFSSLNLGDHVGDAHLAVRHNRALLRERLPCEPFWLKQVHGTRVVSAGREHTTPEADACISRGGGVCGVMSADCLPVLLCDEAGLVVAAVHAGWRGLVAGVLDTTVSAMQVPPSTLMAWLGPAISQTAFEVGDEVRAQFVRADPAAAAAFVPGGRGKYLADLYFLARLRLNSLGISNIYGGDRCTFAEGGQFFSYRREGVTGRQGTFIWLEATAGINLNRDDPHD